MSSEATVEYGYHNNVNTSLVLSERQRVMFSFRQIATNETMVSFEFRTKTGTGVIWYETTWRQRDDGDFFVIFLDNGKETTGRRVSHSGRAGRCSACVEPYLPTVRQFSLEELKVTVNLGNDLSFKAVPIQGTVELNKWHTVNVERYFSALGTIAKGCFRIGRIINVQLDGRPARSIVTTPGSQELNTNGIIYLGGKGWGERDSSPSGGRLQSKRGTLSQLPGRFDGCLRELFINGNKLNLVHDTITEATPLLCHF